MVTILLERPVTGLRLGVLILGGAFAVLLPGVRAHAVEELAYAVETVIGPVEVRRYAPHMLATVRVDGDFEQAGNAAFRPLFDYIAGGNEASEKISMTAPVLQAAGASGWDVSFVMPSRFDAGTLPFPDADQVEIRSETAVLMAALRYSGRWTAANYERHEATLRQTLRGADYRTCGAPLWARYNPPFVPWFLRRNEVLIPVARPGEEC
jgi:hypothetical protein